MMKDYKSLPIMHKQTPYKICPCCYLVNYSAKRLCDDCGYEFYKRKAVKNG